MDTELTAKEFFEFAKEHEKDKDLQFDLTENEQEVLLHTLGYYKQGYLSVRAAEWRNYSDNGSNDRGSYTIAFRHLCELSLMREHIDNNHYIYVYSANHQNYHNHQAHSYTENTHSAASQFLLLFYVLLHIAHILFSRPFYLALSHYKYNDCCQYVPS